LYRPISMRGFLLQRPECSQPFARCGRCPPKAYLCLGGFQVGFGTCSGAQTHFRGVIALAASPNKKLRYRELLQLHLPSLDSPRRRYMPCVGVDVCPSHSCAVSILPVFRLISLATDWRDISLPKTLQNLMRRRPG